MNYSVSSSTHRPPIVWWASMLLQVENIHTWATEVKILSLILLLLLAGVLFDVRWSELIVEPGQGCCRAVQPGHVSAWASALIRFFPCLPRHLLLCDVFLCHVVLFCSFDALVLRFEAPDSRNRWDSPLFTILKDDTLPYEAISDALFKRKAPPPNQSTQSVGLKCFWCVEVSDFHYLNV